MSTATTAAAPQTAATKRAPNEPFLVVDDLTVAFPTADGMVHAVTNLSYTLDLGETLGIVGESGSGKSVSSMAIMGLHDPKRTRMTGSIRLDGDEILGLSNTQMRNIRGQQVSMIFQDALAALHPFYTVGNQLTEAYQAHHHVSKAQAVKVAVDRLGLVGIPQPSRRIDDYPHQFSGGMRQRAMIAMALMNDPKLLIADEPTTALDVTVQAQILDLLQDLQREFGSAVIIITHDLGVIAETADDILVMYAGRCVELGACKEVLTHPEMPYSWGLLGSVPEVASEGETRLIPIPGTPPSLLDPPTGCPFHPRCRYRDRVPGDLCVEQLPELSPGSRGIGHLKRCHLEEAADAIFQTELRDEIGAT